MILVETTSSLFHLIYILWKYHASFLWYYSLMLQKKKERKFVMNHTAKCLRQMFPKHSERFVPELSHRLFLFMLFAFFCGARKQVKCKARWLPDKQSWSPALKVAFMGMDPDIWAPPGIRDTGEGSPWHQTSSITQM